MLLGFSGVVVVAAAAAAAAVPADWDRPFSTAFAYPGSGRAGDAMVVAASWKRIGGLCLFFSEEEGLVFEVPPIFRARSVIPFGVGFGEGRAGVAAKVEGGMASTTTTAAAGAVVVVVPARRGTLDTTV